MKNYVAGILVVLIQFAVLQSAFALDAVSSDRSGRAVEGFDTVAYFTEGEATPGNSDYQYEWNGVTWLFSTDENRRLFAQSPEKFAPQYGGYCAWAVSQGYTASIDPKAWEIVDDKLYLNYNRSVQKRWQKDKATHIKQADVNWPKLLGGS